MPAKEISPGLVIQGFTPPLPLKDFKLTSWRYLHRPEKLVPRALRKLALARGFMVYEGVR